MESDGDVRWAVMTPPADPVVALSRALDQTDVILTHVHEEHLGLPTPCPDWNVEQLIAHLAAGLANDLHEARGEPRDRGSEPGDLGEHWLADFRAGSDDLLHAWHQAGPLDGTVEFPGIGEVPQRYQVDRQTTELAVHGWDLWKATGPSRDLDTGIAEIALGFMTSTLRLQFRGELDGTTYFGAEVQVSGDAPVYDRLVAFAGRDPAWNSQE